jgi:hypothetical protein
LSEGIADSMVASVLIATSCATWHQCLPLLEPEY